MGKKVQLFIGLLIYVFFLFESNVFALTFSVLAYDVGSQPDSVALGDFNGDGKIDLAVANRGSNTVSILIGNGDGTFHAAVNNSVNNPQSMAVGDFDRDGRLDLAVAKGSSNGVSILLGDGDGSFQPAMNYSVNNPQSVAVGDFDRDGRLDLAVARGSSNGVSILLGDGDGSFQPAMNYSAGSNTSSAVIGDFNKDGKLDLAASNAASNTVSILLGKGDGTFQAAVNYSVNNPQSVVVGDFSGDGKLDLAVSSSASNAVSILPGNGDGTFQSAMSYSVGSNPLSLATGDFNGDGKLDLAVSNAASNTVSILLNTTSLATVPGAPTKVIATAGNAQATVSFLAPASNGGSPIISYTVTSSPGNITATGASSPITVSGLTYGTTYTFTVKATNAIGTGPASAPSNSVTWGPLMSVSPMSVNFGPTRVGSTSSPKTVTINNTGNEALIVNSISVTGANPSEFIQTNNCSTVLAQSSCLIDATFAPVMPFGEKNALLVILSNDPRKPAVNVKLSGQAAPPKISATPQSVNFGSIKVGSISAPKVVTVKNTGVSDLIINSVMVTGANAPEFNQENDCSTIAKGSSCAITVTVSPASTGKKNAIIAISSNDPKKPVVNVKLSGKGRI